MARTTEQLTDQQEDFLRSFGYVVTMDPILGEEEAFLDALREAYTKINKVFQHNARTFGFRGKSKNALAALHRDLPTPVWGVEVRL